MKAIFHFFRSFNSTSKCKNGLDNTAVETESTKDYCFSLGDKIYSVNLNGGRSQTSSLSQNYFNEILIKYSKIEKLTR